MNNNAFDQLSERIHKAVETIITLRKEKEGLKGEILQLKGELKKLEGGGGEWQNEKSRIRGRLTTILGRLDRIEV